MMLFKHNKGIQHLLVTALILVVFIALTGCRPILEDGTDSLSIYATFYPIYALTDAVISGTPNTELHCLVQPQDGCLRNYHLSDWDVSMLSTGANAVIAGGRGLESFESQLFEWGEGGPAVSAVLYNLDLYEHGRVSQDSESHLSGFNPHLYMSIEGAGQILESISASMVSLDPQYSDQYISNAGSSCAMLNELLENNRDLLSAWHGRPVAILNEALVYAAQDYNLEIAIQIDRESGSTLVDGEFQACLEKLASAEPDILLVERQSPHAFVEELEAAGYIVAMLDIMSTHREGEGFRCYMQIQAGNAQAIRDAFIRADASGEKH